MSNNSEPVLFPPAEKEKRSFKKAIAVLAIVVVVIIMAIVQGYYFKSDLNGTTSLPILLPPGIFLFCIPEPTPSEYDFYPSSNAAIPQYGTLYNNQSESISTSMSFSGYYNSSQWFSTETINFSPGVYTVIGGDEWGQLVLLHFVVM
jgi:hypothetical protein